MAEHVYTARFWYSVAIRLHLLCELPDLSLTPHPQHLHTSSTFINIHHRPHLTQLPVRQQCLSPHISSTHHSFRVSLGLFVLIASLPFPHHRDQSQVHCLCAIALPRLGMQRRAIRSSSLQPHSEHRRYLPFHDRSTDWSTDSIEHSHGQGSCSTVHQSVHDERWSSAKQHPAVVCK